MSQIDYYFTCISPFSYLGHKTLKEIADRHEATIVLKPMRLRAVWEKSGALPPDQRTEPRKAYRLVELKRWSAHRQLPLNTHPAHFPVDPSLADMTVISTEQQGMDAYRLAGLFLAACWAGEKNLADENDLKSILSEGGFDTGLLDAAMKNEVETIYERNTQDAIGAQIIGAPAYVFHGEQFWGQDRLELLEDALRGQARHG